MDDEKRIKIGNPNNNMKGKGKNKSKVWNTEKSTLHYNTEDSSKSYSEMFMDYYKSYIEHGDSESTGVTKALKACSIHGINKKQIIGEVRKYTEVGRVLDGFKGIRYIPSEWEDSEYFSREPKIVEFGNYTARIKKSIESKTCYLENERLEVFVLDNEKGKLYQADLVTQAYINGIMNDKDLNQEFANGAYFPGAHRIIVRDLSKETVDKTLRSLINSGMLPFWMKEKIQ